MRNLKSNFVFNRSSEKSQDNSACGDDKTARLMRLACSRYGTLGIILDTGKK